MNITFAPLAESHFPLLLKWLETPHVKKWWDHDVTYTMDLVREKYSSYIKGYKLINGAQKPIQSFIIHNNQNPVGYIQIYNAYDFARSKPLSGLPESLGAIDIFIGAEEVLQQGVGSKAILEFLTIHGGLYGHIFVDPDSNNIAAIKAYEKAGFKKVSEQADTGEVWMIKDLSLRIDPLPTIQKLIKERYVQAKAIFWAGSVSEGRGTSASDLDLVIVFEEVAHAYREAFIYDGWPIDAFIHDLDTLRYFFEESRTGNGISGLSYMILNGREVNNPSTFSKNVKTLAQEVLNAGPAAWDKKQLDKERFLITDVLDDIKYPAGRDEQISSAAWLLEALGQFYFRSQNKWCASGKSIIRYLKSDNPDLALEFTQAFANLFQMGDSASLELLAKKILAPHGGLFWDGFRSDASEIFDEKSSKAFINTCKNLSGIKEDFNKHNIYIKQNNKIVAGAIAYIHGKILWLDSIYVEERFQNKGLGRELILKLLELGKAHNLREVQLNTYFPKASEFFKKCGFEEVVVIPNWKYELACYLMRKVI